MGICDSTEHDDGCSDHSEPVEDTQEQAVKQEKVAKQEKVVCLLGAGSFAGQSDRAVFVVCELDVCAVSQSQNAVLVDCELDRVVYL